MNIELYQKLKGQFKSNFLWNCYGIAIFEIVKIIHHFLLLAYFSFQQFGTLGNIYSIIYLTIYFSDLASVISLPPFMTILLKSKKHFKRFLSFYFITTFTFLFPASALVGWGYRLSFLQNKFAPPAIFISALITTEGVRILLRSLIHYMFHSKRVIILENTFTISYYLACWVTLLVTGSLTLKKLFLLFLINSFLMLLHHAYFLFLKYKNLIIVDERMVKQDINDALYRRVIKLRLSNFFIQIVENFFTGNFLIPLFSFRYGISEGGILKLASMIADSLKSIIRSSIGYTGNAFFAYLKNQSIDVKKEAFRYISERLNNFFYFILLFLGINFKHLVSFKISLSHLTTTTIIFAFLFLLVVLAENFFLVYRQLYNLEEKSHKYLFFKLLEFVLFYLFVFTNSVKTPVITLISILSIQILSYLLLSYNAKVNWKIKPVFKIKKKMLLLYTTISLLFFILFKVLNFN